jgi:hypothetical protein
MWSMSEQQELLVEGHSGMHAWRVLSVNGKGYLQTRPLYMERIGWDTGVTTGITQAIIDRLVAERAAHEQTRAEVEAWVGNFRVVHNGMSLSQGAFDALINEHESVQAERDALRQELEAARDEIGLISERDLLRAQLADVTEKLACAESDMWSARGERDRLRAEAMRFYMPDGSYQTLDTPEQVVELRKAAAAQNAKDRAEVERLKAEGAL